jgi:hypothetical protein
MPDRERALAAIVDTFVPAADGLPSASELGVHVRLLEEVRALGRPSLQGQLDLVLRLIDTRAGNLALTGRATAFSRMDQEAREAAMRRLAASPIPLKRTAFQDLKRLTLLLAYGIEDSPWRARTGFVAPPPDAPAPSRVTVRTPRAGEVIEADVAVIGSGAGGGVAASILAAAGRKVVVLERAAMVSEQQFGGPELAGLGALFLDRGLAATTDRWIDPGRQRSAAARWSTGAPRCASRGGREEWRAARIGDDLDEHYAAIEAEIGVTRDESEPNGPNGRLAAGLDALGLPWEVMPRGVRDCTDCGPCAVGCRSGAKQSALRTTLAAACASGAEILDRSEVRRILLENGRAAGVVARVEGGRSGRAPMVAVAGAPSSPRRPASLRDRHGAAGRGLHLRGHRDRRHLRRVARPLVRRAAKRERRLAGIDGRWGSRSGAPAPGLIATGFRVVSRDHGRR